MFRDHALARRTHHVSGAHLPVQARVQDIEDLFQTGKKLSACAYYGSRRAIAAAQVCLSRTA